MGTPRITDELQHPLDTFTRCQRCGYQGKDIVDFRFWVEGDEEDAPPDQ